jgi:hypothetical protein
LSHPLVSLRHKMSGVLSTFLTDVRITRER